MIQQLKVPKGEGCFQEMSLLCCLSVDSMTQLLRKCSFAGIVSQGSLAGMFHCLLWFDPSLGEDFRKSSVAVEADNQLSPFISSFSSGKIFLFLRGSPRGERPQPVLP